LCLNSAKFHDVDQIESVLSYTYYFHKVNSGLLWTNIQENEVMN